MNIFVNRQFPIRHRLINYLLQLVEDILFPKARVNQKVLAEKLQHKTIIITGASFGIGEALCHILSGIDCQLILVARTKEKLDDIQHSLRHQKATIHIFTADLSKEDQLSDFIEYIKNYSVDIFVSNAGKSICRPIAESLDRFHDFQRTMQLNYFVPVRLCLSLIPIMQQTRGHIINVSAVNVLLAPTVHWAAYQASKTAFDQWLRCASPELIGKNHIAVSTAYFPLVRTRMIAPTKAYDHVPAMSKEQAALKLCDLMMSRANIYKPWWAFMGQYLSLCFAKLWFKFNIYYVKKHSS